MLVAAQSEATIKQTQNGGGSGERHNYIGASGELSVGPQAFLVVRPFAGARIEPHFHDVDQFQVIVAGDGHIGKKAVRPVTFQYADAFTPYGPIVGNEHGFAFFTFRNIASGGFWAMPGNRQHMPGRPGRNIEGVFELSDSVPAANEVVREALMPTQDDGVDVVGMRLGPGAVATGLPANAQGQFYLVCAGSIEADGKTLPTHSMVRVEPGDAAIEMVAGEAGAHVLALQFAGASQRPGTDPAKAAMRNGYVNIRRES